MKQAWRVWCKTMGDKISDDSDEADVAAVIRSFFDYKFNHLRLYYCKCITSLVICIMLFTSPINYSMITSTNNL